MPSLRRVFQPVTCQLGIHEAPPPREPHGPIVATCPCCKQTVYFYGLSAHGMGNYTNLMLPEFPRVLKALPPAYAS